MKKILSSLICILLITFISAGTSICIDLDAPEAPTQLEITGTVNNILLTWNIPFDEPSCSGIDYYQIYRNSEFINSTTQLSYTDNSGYGSYTFEVLAVDLAGNKGANISKQLSLTAPNSGGGGGSSGGGGGSSGGISLLSTNSSQEITTGLNILLPNTEYPLQFNQEAHKIIIDEVGENYIWVTISSEPQKIKILFSDGKKEIDIDQDGIFDMTIELISINNNKEVVLKYQEIKNEIVNDFQELGFSSMDETTSRSFLTGAVTGISDFSKSKKGIGTFVVSIGILTGLIFVRRLKKSKEI
jgi:hypothetical protein